MNIVVGAICSIRYTPVCVVRVYNFIFLFHFFFHLHFQRNRPQILSFMCKKKYKLSIHLIFNGVFFFSSHSFVRSVLCVNRLLSGVKIERGNDSQS